MNGSQLTPTSMYHLSYEIPRIVIGSPSHNRPNSDGRLYVTPGTFQPLEFSLEGIANKPLNLLPFKAKLVFWENRRIDTKDENEMFSTEQSYNVLFSIQCEIPDPYAGRAFAMLTDENTQQINHVAENAGVRWGVFLINEDNQVFAMAVTTSGSTSGEVVIRSAGATPPASLILGS